jgi:hypothetical protein
MWQYVYNGVKEWTCICWFFSFIQYPLSFVINIACDLSNATNDNLFVKTSWKYLFFSNVSVQKNVYHM